MTRTYININGDVRDASSLNVPADRTFRGAWQFSGNAVTVDMDKAKLIWADKIRAARIPEFEVLDTAFMKAMETGADTSEIIAKKRALRDAPADERISLAPNAHTLMAIKPAGLDVK